MIIAMVVTRDYTFDKTHRILQHKEQALMHVS